MHDARCAMREADALARDAKRVDALCAMRFMRGS
jgi:hypothetical protein